MSLSCAISVFTTVFLFYQRWAGCGQGEIALDKGSDLWHMPPLIHDHVSDWFSRFAAGGVCGGSDASQAPSATGLAGACRPQPQRG
jgi:hypothetical protein